MVHKWHHLRSRPKPISNVILNIVYSLSVLHDVSVNLPLWSINVFISIMSMACCMQRGAWVHVPKNITTFNIYVCVQNAHYSLKLCSTVHTNVSNVTILFSVEKNINFPRSQPRLGEIKSWWCPYPEVALSRINLAVTINSRRIQILQFLPLTPKKSN